MAKTFSKENVIKGFTANGQLDSRQNIVPSAKCLVETYRGFTDGTPLEDRDSLMANFYLHMFQEGYIKEAIHDLYGIEKDKNGDGEEVDRDFTIVNENRQRAKVLSSKFQRNLRIKLINESNKKRYDKEKELFNRED